MDRYLWRKYFQLDFKLDYLMRLGSVCRQEVNSPDYIGNCAKRAHETHCIFHYTLSGRGACRYRGKTYPLTPGNGFLCVINDPEMDYFYPEDGKDIWEFIWISYMDGDSRKMTQRMMEEHGPVFPLPLNHFLTDRLCHYGEETMSAVSLNPYESDLFVRELLATLGSGISRKKSEELFSPGVRNAIQNIEKDLFRRGIKELAEDAGLSREHFSKKFRRETGVSLKDFIAKKKLILACQMLCERGAVIEKIAKKLRYSTSSNFARMFKRSIGITPEKFQERSESPAMTASLMELIQSENSALSGQKK